MPTGRRKRDIETEEVAGTQSIGRAVAVLRVVSQSGEKGVRSGDVAAALGLNVATTHRILTALLKERLVERRDGSMGYRIGPEIVALAASVPRGFSIEGHLKGALERIAERTGDTTFLTIRAGRDQITLARQEGAFPIRTLTSDVGARRPLGIGASGVAILAALPAIDADAIIAQNEGRYRDHSTTVEVVRALTTRARSLGYALNDGRVLPDMTAVAVALTNTLGQVVGSISVSAINARMTPDRRQEILAVVGDTLQGLVPLPIAA